MARQLQEILNSGEVTGQTMAPGYNPSGDKDVSVNDHHHDADYEPAASNIQAHIAQQTGNPHNVNQTDVGLGNVNNTTDLNKPVSTATQTALNGKESADPALQAHLGATGNPHSVTAGEVGLGNVDNTTDASKAVSTATQDALDLKAEVVHAHDAQYFRKDEFVETGGTPDQGLQPVRLRADGTFDPAMVGFDGLTPQGAWTPTGIQEYPDTTGAPGGSFWIVEGLGEGGYEFTGGDLLGQTAEDGSIMLLTQNGWAMLSGAGSVDPTVYLRLDGTTPMQGPFNSGGFKVLLVGDGTDQADAVNRKQLDTKAETVHTHTEGQITGLDKYTQAEVDGLVGGKEDADPAIQAHLGDPNNPHGVTADQVGAVGTAPEGVGSAIGNMLSLTQAEYDGLGVKQPDTFYVIVG